MNPDTIAWVEALGRNVIDRQLGEVARLDAKARELLGFVGVVLALLAAAASQVESVAGPIGTVVYIAAAVSAVTLVWAGFRAAWPLISSSYKDYEVLDHETLMDMDSHPGLLDQTVDAVQGISYRKLLLATRINARRVERLDRQLSAAYGWFMVGLGAAGVVVLALVASLT